MMFLAYILLGLLAMAALCFVAVQVWFYCIKKNE